MPRHRYTGATKGDILILLVVEYLLIKNYRISYDSIIDVYAEYLEKEKIPFPGKINRRILQTRVARLREFGYLENDPTKRRQRITMTDKARSLIGGKKFTQFPNDLEIK